VRVLLDEQLPLDLAAALQSHRVDTVVGRGWTGITNGELLRRMRGEYDALVTMDQGLEFQQNLATVPFACFFSVRHPTAWPTSNRSCQRSSTPSRHSSQGTLTQVVALLGKPTGMFIYPSEFVKVSDHRAYVYSYSRTDKSLWGGQLKTVTKTLIITFDPRDVVIETKLATGGNR